MIEYRKARQEDRKAYLDFADMVFQDHGTDICFEQAIPKVYGPDKDTAALQRIAVDDRLGIRGLVAALPGTLHTPAGDLTTGYVGTVSVHPQARGEGHMKRLMVDWLAEKTADGTDLLLLGGRRQRYGYFGFAQAGWGWRLHISADSVRHGLKNAECPEVSFMPLAADSDMEKAAQALQMARPAWYDRRPFGFVCACRSYHHAPQAAVNGQGSLIGCLTVKENDPSAAAELLVREPRDADAVLKAWMGKHALKNMTLQVAPWDTDLLKHLRTWAEDSSCYVPLMARTVRYDRVIPALMALKAETGGAVPADGTLCLDVEGNTFTVEVRSGKCTVRPGGRDPLKMTHLQANTLLFDAFPMEGKPRVPEGWFPLPVYASAPDEF